MTTAPDIARVAVRTVELADPGPLLELLPESGALAWVRRGAGLVGWGTALRGVFSGVSRFADAERWWSATARTSVVRDEVGLAGAGLVAFGSFAFADDPGASVLVVPEVVVGARDGRWWMTTVGVDGVLPSPPALCAPSPARRPAAVRFADGARSGADWE
ncbi:MAG: isochorismate synthase, partial [Actinomycetota bacterium]|nr:isochorismate synthase [Actinomycetota bacterium]